MTWFAIAVGGGLGSMARHAVNLWLARLHGGPSPYSTAIVNIVGCAAIGVLAGLVAGGQLRLSPTARAGIFVGVLGGFTTFSSFGLDTLTLAHEGRHAAALGNILLQVGVGLPSVFAGYAIGVRLGQ